MRADRRRAGRVRPYSGAAGAGWAASLSLAFLLTGCASMPDSSGVSKVGESPRADADSQVRVFGVKPQPNDDALSLVRGFLEATTSDEADYRTARLYLTEERARKWDPFAGITVLANSPSPTGRPERGDAGSYRVDLSGTRTAWVDSKHAYTPSEGSYQTTFRLTRERGQWRIDSLPNGLVLSQADFQRIYRSVNMYYYSASSAVGQGVFVPDPVYLRRRIDPLTSAVRALLDGPTDWLSPVVVSEFPRGTALADDKGLELTESGRLRVRLRERVLTGQPQCERMAVQLFRTVQEQAATKVQEVELAHEDESTACTVTGRDAEQYSPQKLVRAADQQYFLDKQRRLAVLDAEDAESRPVPGPFGEGAVRLRSAAVGLDGRVAAGVRDDGRALYVGDLASGAGRGDPVLRSKGAKADERLSAPSWDGLGDLWVADRDPDRSRLVVLRGTRQFPVEVPGLRGGRIQAVRVAPDGVRIALLVREKDRTTLKLGRVERRGAEQEPRIAVEELRSVAPQLEDVNAASWAGLSRILVVGREAQGVPQMSFVDTDGSMPFAPSLPGISQVTAVAASVDERQPLLADSADGIFRLRQDSNWKRVAPEGSSPVYPG